MNAKAKQLLHFLTHHAGLILTILAFCGLWFLAYQEFQDYEGSYFRIDRKDQIAVPYSDAGNDLMNATAILSGDGFVNWRPITQHQVYKPGWTLFLAFLMWFHDRDLVDIQNTMIILNALVIPLLYLFISSLFEERRPAPISFLAALIYFFVPLNDWMLFKTLMTEGPTTVLLLLFLIIIVQVSKKKKWAWWLGLLAGMLAASLELIRNQAKYGFILVTFAVVLLVLWRFRSRWKFLLFYGLGYLMLIIPVYGLISLNTGRLYTGSNYTSMVAVLHFSELGQNAGGIVLTREEKKSELVAYDVLRERVSGVLSERIKHPIEVWQEGFPSLHQYVLGSPLKLVADVGKSIKQRRTVLLWLFIFSIVLSLIRMRLQVFIPLLFTIGYLAPNFALRYFWDRFGDPVGWLGIAFLAGILIQLSPLCRQTSFIKKWRVFFRWFRIFRRKIKSKGLQLFRPQRMSWNQLKPDAYKVLVCTVCTLLFFAILMMLDRKPLNFPDEQAILNHPEVAMLLEESNEIELAELIIQIKKSLQDSNAQKNVRMGFLMFPQVMEPGDSILVTPWLNYSPVRSTETNFFLLMPWKQGRFRNIEYKMEGKLWDNYKVGEPVLIFNSENLERGNMVKVIRLTSDQ